MINLQLTDEEKTTLYHALNAAEVVMRDRFMYDDADKVRDLRNKLLAAVKK